MKKDKIIMTITISIMSLILVCVMLAQFRVVNETDIAQIESMREDELEKAVTQWKEKYEKTNEKLTETNQKIQEYQEKVQSNNETRELVEKELQEAKENFGLTDVTGDGLIITLTDTNTRTYEDKDLLDLVNELRAAGAKAISINDERIVSLTNIVNISTKFIKINDENVASPYVIKAIGDKTYLKSALTIKNGYYDYKNKEGYSIDIQEKSNIKINKYSKNVNLRYIEL